MGLRTLILRHRRPRNRFGNALPQALNRHGIEKVLDWRGRVQVFHVVTHPRQRTTEFRAYVRLWGTTCRVIWPGPVYVLREPV